MADLYILFYGKSKHRLKPIMVDELKKCQNYRDARGERMGGGWHKIEKAPQGAKTWRQQGATVKGSGDKTNRGPARIGKDGKTLGLSGYIDKSGFQANT